jgi:hypothetical protein
MTQAGGVVSRLRQPEYTGENRCLPCTVANSIIALGLGLVVGVAGAGVASVTVGAVAGMVVLGVSAAAIYLRGYLVPGTPELTKRYFPPWLLRAFGKTPDPDRELGVDPDEQIDPESVLLRLGALEECADRDDLCLTPGFRREWHRAIDADDADREELLALLGIEEYDHVTTQEHGDAFRAIVDGQMVGKWESEAAFVADYGAARALSDRFADWDALPTVARSQLLNGLRLFIDTCPDCGGVPEFGTDTVESCCSTHEVAAVACTDCGARLFESRPV